MGETVIVQVNKLQFRQVVKRPGLNRVNQIGLEIQEINLPRATEVVSLDCFQQIDAEIDIANVYKFLKRSSIDFVEIVVHQVDELDLVPVLVGVEGKHVFAKDLKKRGWKVDNDCCD